MSDEEPDMSNLERALPDVEPHGTHREMVAPRFTSRAGTIAGRIKHRPSWSGDPKDWSTHLCGGGSHVCRVSRNGLVRPAERRAGGRSGRLHGAWAIGRGSARSIPVRDRCCQGMPSGEPLTICTVYLSDYHSQSQNTICPTHVASSENSRHRRSANPVGIYTILNAS